jgi:hypothetical protein
LASLGMAPINSSVQQLDAILAFLAPLDVKADREKSSSVTVGKWPHLLQHATVTDEDSDTIRQLKSTLRDELQIMNITVLVDKCKRLVTHLKVSGLDTQINGHLKQESEVVYPWSWAAILYTPGPGQRVAYPPGTPGPAFLSGRNPTQPNCRSPGPGYPRSRLLKRA